MAKRPRKEPVGITKKQAALSRRDQVARRRLIIGLIIASVVIVGVIVAGLVNEFVVKPNAPVAIVNGERIPTQKYQKWVKFQRNNLTRYIRDLEAEKARYDPEDENSAPMIQFYDQLIASYQAQLTNIGVSVVDQMIDDLLIRQGAAQEGISVSPEEVTLRIEELFGYHRIPPTPAPTPTPDSTAGTEAPTPAPTPTPMTQEDFQRLYTLYLNQLKQTAGFDEADYRSLIEGEIYRDKLEDLIRSRVPTQGEQVWARHILVQDEETANKVLERLRAGEDFAALAEEFSIDSSNKSSGGDLGWFGRGRMVKEFEDVAFSLPVGEISSPVKTSFGYHIIKVEAHEMSRPWDEATLSQLQSRAFSEWLMAAREKADIRRLWSPDKMPPEGTPAL